MEKTDFWKTYSMSLGRLIKSSRASYTLMILTVVIWAIFVANLLLNGIGLSIAGMNRLGLENVFNAFLVISLVFIVPMVIITLTQISTLKNGMLHPAVITSVVRDRDHLVVKYAYAVSGACFNKTRLIKCKDNVDLSYFTKEREEQIVINSSNPSNMVFVDHSFIKAEA